jgi:molybdenum cofactor cytidylyltransferase
MTIPLQRALRLGRKEVVTLVGGGGKTALMFRLADELAAGGSRVVTTMTTRIFVGQMARAPARLIDRGEGALLAQLPAVLADHGHVLVAGGADVEEDKAQGVSPDLIARIAAQPAVDAVIVEADGSRRLPFKAPAAHEPVVPSSTTVLVPMAGLDVLGRPLTADFVHRPALVAALTGAAEGDPVTPEMVAAVLAHPAGGAKGLPDGARLIPFLNKADDASRLAEARAIARSLLLRPQVDSVVIGALESPEPTREVWTRVGAVLLAAGGASRFGALKQLAPWRGRPLVAHVLDQALACPDLSAVAVTVGAGAAAVRSALGAHATIMAEVPDWADGQSRSVRAGLAAMLAERPEIGAALFLLADQPGVTPELLSALVQRHRETLAPVVAPRHNGRRGNPVLFDRATFGEFASLSGDVGARPIIQAHAGEIVWVDWPTPDVLQDIDTPADLSRPD